MPRSDQEFFGLTDTWGRRNRKHADKNCMECGTTFKPKRADTAYCSRPCARKKNGGQNIQMQTWWVNGKGYVEGRILTAQGHRSVKQHRFVMECHIGRRLRRDEDVHHIDECKTNNALSNLQLLSHAEHTRLHNLDGSRYAITKALQS